MTASAEKLLGAGKRTPMTTSKYEFHQFQDVDNMVMAK
jgi:hypothetical protein